MTITQAAAAIKAFIKAQIPNEHIEVRAKGDTIAFTNLPLMVEARGLAEYAAGLKFEICGHSVVRLVEFKPDHTHRDDEGNRTLCEKSKAECDAWHYAAWERKEAA